MKLSDEQIKKLRDYFHSKPVTRAFVFGSYARGDADEKSDLDILVELDPDKPIGLEFYRMQFDIQEITHTIVDVATMDSLTSYIIENVERDKELIYEK